MATSSPDAGPETEPNPGTEVDDEPEQKEPICGEPTTDGSPCERRTKNGEPCFLHRDDGPPDNHGAPEGNSNGEGNAGGGAPDGNDNAFKHGFHMATSRRLELFDDDQLALFGDYYFEFIQKVENESAAARLATLAVIADELEAEVIQNGVFRDVIDVGDGESRDAPTGRTPKNETLNTLLRVLRELQLGKESEGVTGNDMDPTPRVKQHFSNRADRSFGDRDELPWRNGVPGIVQVKPDEAEKKRPERSPLPDDLPDGFDPF